MDSILKEKERPTAQIVQNTEYLDKRALECIETKIMIDNLKKVYNELKFPAQFELIEEMLATKELAINKPFLEERISQTSLHLQKAIENLMKPELKIQKIKLETQTSIFKSYSDTLDEVSSPKSTDQLILITPKPYTIPSILKGSRNNERQNSDRSLRKSEEKRKIKFIEPERNTPQSNPSQSQPDPPPPPTSSNPPTHTTPVIRPDDRCTRQADVTHRPQTDVDIATHISAPAVVSMDRLWLADGVVAMCVAVVSDCDVVVGTEKNGILLTDFRSKRWIKLPNEAGVVGVKSWGRMVVCCLDSPTDNLWLVDLENSDDMMMLKGHSKGVTDVAWTDNAKHLVSVGKDGKLVFWSWNPLSQIKRLKVSNLPINSVTILTNSNLVVTGGDDATIKIFCITGDSITYKNSIQDTVAVTKVDSFYQNTKLVVSKNLLGEIKSWDILSGK